MTFEQILVVAIFIASIAYILRRIQLYIRCKRNERIIREWFSRVHAENLPNETVKVISKVKMKHKTGKIFTLKRNKK